MIRLLATALAIGLAPTLSATAEVHDTERLPIAVQTVTDGLVHPWGMAFLPDGAILVTERPGTMRIVSPSGVASAPIAGVPEVVSRGQGGLLDVTLHPDFAANRLVYWSYAEAGEGGTNGTAIARGRLSDDRGRLEDVEVIFRQQPKVRSTAHFGSRLEFDRDGLLFATLGERSAARYRVMAQDLGTHLGKVIRIRDDGSVPPDNPFVGQDGAMPEIWSYGHRNPQGMHEHGPRGGDEVAIPAAGDNHGWPVFSYGTEYSKEPITDLDEHPPEFARPVWQWTPSIAPSGMAFYAGAEIPEWEGSLLVGALRGSELVRLTLDGTRVAAEERMLGELGVRFRDVTVGPDGAVYVLTDAEDGAILRIVAAD
ncbi:MAG: PQQ-dependent sugar dehydrogenase [Rhizobiales bacterium]|nr:PQQ-dependent sugar dehydrogenase [Hyphomicrobiales bacterium]